MNEWLLSGHNTQESAGLVRPFSWSLLMSGIEAQGTWFLAQLAGDTSDFDPTLDPVVVVQGRTYVNLTYYARNMGRVLPTDPASIGVPAELVMDVEKVPLGRLVALPGRFLRIYRGISRFYRQELAGIADEMRTLYWKLREMPDQESLSLIWSAFAEPFYTRCHAADRAHIILTITTMALDGILRQRVPQLLGLFVGHETATSLLGQRIWQLRETAEACGETVTGPLLAGRVTLDVYEALPAAAPFVAELRALLRQYGHRGFQREFESESGRLADHPEHVLLAVAAQLKEGRAPQERAEEARAVAEAALRALDPVSRAAWGRLLRWGQQIISWREESKSALSMYWALYGVALRKLSRHFYPDRPEDLMFFYTLDELLAFARTQGQQALPLDVLLHRQAEFSLYEKQAAPPELIWYDPQALHWRAALEAEEPLASAEARTRFEGIAASGGKGVVEGVALATNDPLEAGRRLLELSGPVILVTHMTDPAWSSLFGRLAAVVTELGGVISHAAIVARENGLPAVVGVPDITRWVRNGQRLRVDGARGVVEILESKE